MEEKKHSALEKKPLLMEKTLRTGEKTAPNGEKKPLQLKRALRKGENYNAPNGESPPQWRQIAVHPTQKADVIVTNS